MPVKLIFAPEVQQDLDEAYSWYEDRRYGLGEEFINCVDVVIQTILRSPDLYSKIYKEYRRALIRRFPFAVFYELIDNKAIIYSVFHTSQNPEKWKNRLP